MGMLLHARLLALLPVRPATRYAALHATRMQYADYGFDAGPRAPSDKQVRYAQLLAQRAALELPPEALVNGEECSAFIDKALQMTPPSERQIEFARSIARAANLELPEHALVSSKSVSAYIEANQHLSSGISMPGYTGGSSSSREPTEKQILFAATLARRLNVGLTAEVLQSRQAMSTFLDQSQQQLRGSPVGGGGMLGDSMLGGVGGVGATSAAAAAFSAAGSPAFNAADADLLSPEAGGEDINAELDSLFSEPKGEDEPNYYKEGSIPF